VAHRLDHLVDDETAEDLGPFLLAGGADAAELAGEGHQLLVAAVAAADPGEPCGEDPAAQILFERAPRTVGQRAVLVEEPLIVGFEEQLQVLSDRQVQVGPLRPPGPVDARRLLAHADREEQDRDLGSGGQ
jgi:hypothetical protein